MKGDASASAVSGRRLGFGFKQQHLAETATDVSTPRSTQQRFLWQSAVLERAAERCSCCQFKMTGKRKDVLVNTRCGCAKSQPPCTAAILLTSTPASVQGRTQTNPSATDLQALRPSCRARRMLCPQLGPSPAPQCAPASSPQPWPAPRTPGSPRSGHRREEPFRNTAVIVEI